MKKALVIFLLLVGLFSFFGSVAQVKSQNGNKDDGAIQIPGILTLSSEKTIKPNNYKCDKIILDDGADLEGVSITCDSIKIRPTCKSLTLKNSSIKIINDFDLPSKFNEIEIEGKCKIEVKNIKLKTNIKIRGGDNPSLELVYVTISDSSFKVDLSKKVTLIERRK